MPYCFFANLPASPHLLHLLHLGVLADEINVFAAHLPPPRLPSNPASAMFAQLTFIAAQNLFGHTRWSGWGAQTILSKLPEKTLSLCPQNW